MSVAVAIFKQALTVTAFVTVMMLVIEYINVFTGGVWQTRLTRNRWGQYFLAAFLGAAPGCLGAFAVVGMYGHGVLTHGAVIAAMVATMGDESFVMLAMAPGAALLTLGVLFVLGVIVGALADLVAQRWMALKPAACKELEVHRAESCRCFPRGDILRQWRECSAPRGILTAVLSLLILALLFGQLGAASRTWIRVTVLGVAAAALFMAATVPDHFLEEHLWNHVVRRHVPRIFLWTLGALAAMHFLTSRFEINETLHHGRWFLLAAACLVGLIPESGPHLVFVTLYAQGAIPFGVLLGSAVVQDGHGMLPLLAQSRRAFFAIKGVNFLVGILVGTAALLASAP